MIFFCLKNTIYTKKFIFLLVAIYLFRMCFVSVMHPFLCLTEANNGLVLILNIMEYYGLAADILEKFIFL